MNKMGLIIVILVIAVMSIFVFGGKKNVNKNVTTTTNQTVDNKNIAEKIVTVTSSGFEPQGLAIKAGVKVIWVNKAGTVVTVDSALHPTHLVYPPLNLGQFADGKSVSLVFNEPGTYVYHNHLNPTQIGNVTVTK